MARPPSTTSLGIRSVTASSSPKAPSLGLQPSLEPGSRCFSITAPPPKLARPPRHRCSGVFPFDATRVLQLVAPGGSRPRWFRRTDLTAVRCAGSTRAFTDQEQCLPKPTWCSVASVSNTRRHNNALHQTGRGGAVASRPVVEARPAGERECSTGTKAVPETEDPRRWKVWS